MKKNYIGTYAKIILLIIIIALIIVGCVYFVQKQYIEENFQTVKTNMLLIEAKVKVIAEKVTMKEKDVSYIGIKLSEMEEDESIKKLLENNVISLDEKNHTYYVLKKEHLDQLGLSNIEKKEGYYIVDYKEIDVIDSMGVKNIEGKLFYRLTEMK